MPAKSAILTLAVVAAEGWLVSHATPTRWMWTWLVIGVAGSGLAVTLWAVASDSDRRLAVRWAAGAASGLAGYWAARLLSTWLRLRVDPLTGVLIWPLPALTLVAWFLAVVRLTRDRWAYIPWIRELVQLRPLTEADLTQRRRENELRCAGVETDPRRLGGSGTVLLGRIPARRNDE